ncbi:MAG TPA: amidohydrolase, partial [Stellaceae bacterium]|nr:amidohydrolase [Stellaceae bacterium]
MELLPQIAESCAEIARWRHDIHAHPELGFKEERTADLVAQQLVSFGCEVHRGIAETGVVGRLVNGNSPRTIGLRADMDALPIEEETALSYRSR